MRRSGFGTLATSGGGQLNGTYALRNAQQLHPFVFLLCGIAARYLATAHTYTHRHTNKHKKKRYK
jgi:hypothetical protein